MATKASDWVLRPALCVDLDGTVRFNKNDPKGFINRVEEIALFPGVEEKLWLYRDGGTIFGSEADYHVPEHLIFGVSNQGGVAFGFKDWGGVDEEARRTAELFERNPFHIMKFCLHHERGDVEPYCHRSLARKPDIGMLAQMEVEAFGEGYVVDWDQSMMVGDREEDQELARRAGIDFRWADVFFGRAYP